MNARQYLESLPAWDQVPRLDERLNMDKDDILAAEVTLPVVASCDVSQLRFVQMRRPFCRHAELILVDASRLPAP